MDHDEHSVSAFFFFVGVGQREEGVLEEAPAHLQSPPGVQMPSGLTFMLEQLQVSGGAVS